MAADSNRCKVGLRVRSAGLARPVLQRACGALSSLWARALSLLVKEGMQRRLFVGFSGVISVVADVARVWSLRARPRRLKT